MKVCMIYDFGRWRVSECALRAANNTTDLPNGNMSSFSGREAWKGGR